MAQRVAQLAQVGDLTVDFIRAGMQRVAIHLRRAMRGQHLCHVGQGKPRRLTQRDQAQLRDHLGQELPPQPLAARLGDEADIVAIAQGAAAVMMGTLVVGPFFLSFGAGLSARMVGVVMAVGPVMSIIGGVMAGRAVDRFGAGPVARLGSWLVALGSFTLALLSPVWGVMGYLIGIAVMTPGYQLFQAGNTSAVMARAPEGALGAARNLGLLIGAWGFDALFTRALGGVPVQSVGAGDIADAVRVVFLVACVGIIGLGVLLWRRG